MFPAVAMRTFAIAAIVFILTLTTILYNHSNTPSISKTALIFTSDSATLKQKQCSIHDILYKDIRNTEAFWRTHGGMTREELELSREICERDGNCANIKIWDGAPYIRLPIMKDLGFQSRSHSMLLMLMRADFSNTPDADFLFNSNDGVRINEPCFMEMNKKVSERDSMERSYFNHFLLPDFTTFDWWEVQLPPFQSARRHLARDAGPFEDKVPKMLYRGSPILQQGTQRSDLIAKMSDLKDIADVHSVEGPENKKFFMSIDEICGYKYIIYTEGVAYSGRLKFTTVCNSVQMGYPITFVEFWSHLLDDYYVEVDDWDDAIVKYHKLQEQPERAKQLAEGTAEIVQKHLTNEGIDCYIQEVVAAYARSCTWKVRSPLEDTKGRDENGTMKEGWMWMPLEHYIVKTLRQGSDEVGVMAEKAHTPA